MKKRSPHLAAGALLAFLSTVLFILWYTDAVGSTFTMLGTVGIATLAVALRVWNDNRGVGETTREQQH